MFAVLNRAASPDRQLHGRVDQSVGLVNIGKIKPAVAEREVKRLVVLVEPIGFNARASAPPPMRKLWLF